MQQAASNAQQLARETVEELKKQNAPGSASSSDSAAAGQQGVPGTDRGGGSAAGEQQRQQGHEQQDESTATGSSSAGAAGQAGGAGAASGRLGITQRLQGFAAAAAREIARAVRSEQPSSSALRGASVKAGDVQTAGTDALAVSQQQQSAWQRQFEDMRSKVCPGLGKGCTWTLRVNVCA